MQYELGDIVLFDGGPALIIGRETEERTYLIEFTGATGKRKKTVTDRDLDDAPTEWHVSNHLELVHEVMALRNKVKEDGLKYECKICQCEVNEEDFIPLSHGDIWLCNACRESVVRFSVEGD